MRILGAKLLQRCPNYIFGYIGGVAILILGTMILQFYFGIQGCCNFILGLHRLCCNSILGYIDCVAILFWVT